MTLLHRAILLCLTLMTTSAYADKWEDADAAFAKRGEDSPSSQKNFDAAKSKYLKILKEATTKTDKVRAVTQLGRLSHYYGEMVLPMTATKKRTKIFGECWCKKYSLITNSCSSKGFVESISPKNTGEEFAAYYYYKGLCKAYWGQVQPKLTQVRTIAGLVDVIEKAIKVEDIDFEGRGPYRLAAGVYSNEKVKPLGYYKIEKATELGKKGLQGVGAEWFTNWWGMTTVYMARHKEDPQGGWEDLAIETSEEALETMDGMIANNNKPENRVPEFDHMYSELKVLFLELTGEQWVPDL